MTCVLGLLIAQCRVCQWGMACALALLKAVARAHVYMAKCASPAQALKCASPAQALKPVASSTCVHCKVCWA
jgi:hypothetical protein